MLGRLNGIKKTYILRIVAIIMFLGFVATIFLDAFFFKSPKIWFYSFFIVIGIYHISKGILFCLDSSFYFGSLFSCLGSFGIIYTLTSMKEIWLLVSLSFLISSLLTFTKFYENYHLVIAYSIIFANIYLICLTKNLISLPVFIAFVVPFLLLLILIGFINLKRK